MSYEDEHGTAVPETPDHYTAHEEIPSQGKALSKGEMPSANPEDINSSGILFGELPLPEDIQTAIADLGFTSPTAIQAEAIPFLMEGRDVLGVAQTGTGKTAAFGLPLLAHINPENSVVQALVLAPTRELAMQGAQAIESFATRSRNVDIVAVYGGSAYGPQLRALENGAQVVVGTPGRIMDLMERGALSLEHVSYFVLDEADEMLRMGFAEAVEEIAQSLPEERISALFSATMPPPIRRIADQYLTDPAEVTISRPASTVSTVHQTFAIVPERHKIGALARVLAVTEADAALVFVRTRATAEDLAIELSVRGVAASALSGDVAQRDREKLVARLREGTLDVLVATDVAARGLDVERIGLVVNFDVPRETDTYVHRIGRTGRAGRSGEALTFVTPRERARLRRIEKTTKSHMEQVELPTPAAVSKLRAQRLVERAVERFANGRLGVYEEVLAAFDHAQAHLRNNATSVEGMDGDVTETAHEEARQPYPQMSREDLIYALLALGVRDPGPVAGEEPEKLTVDMDEREGSRDRGRERGGREHGRKSRPSMAGATRYRVEVGHKDRVKPGAIVGAITAEGGLRGSDLGHIDIFPTFSLVEIGVPLSGEARRRISQARVSGRALRISEDHGPGGRRFAEDEREERYSRREDRYGDRPSSSHEDRPYRTGRTDRGDYRDRKDREERDARSGRSSFRRTPERRSHERRSSRFERSFDRKGRGRY